MNQIKKQELDEKIKKALQRRADALDQASSKDAALRSRVSQRIEEETAMRLTGWNFKKVLLTAGAMCILGSAVALASGEFEVLFGYSSRNEEVTEYTGLSSLKETYQIPFEVKAPETFANGFAFASAYPVHSSGQDAEGNETTLPTEISITYEKSGMADVNLNESKALPGSLSWEHGTAHDIDGQTYYFTKEHYRFVPPSYEITEEEQKAVDAGEMYISYGTEQVEDKWVSNVTWQEDGVSYLLMSFDTSLTEDEMVDMAVEVME